jgi:hypothetical protein
MKRPDFKKWTWERKMIAAAAGLAFLPLFFSFATSQRSEPSVSNPAFSADTEIPHGFVLIPIEVANYEALDSVLGKFGVVDLFLAGENSGGQKRLVARNVRILRAPRNPSHFAVLVPEAQSNEILRFGGSFLVSVKGRNAPGTEFVKSKKTIRRKIVYGGSS